MRGQSRCRPQLPELLLSTGVDGATQVSLQVGGRWGEGSGLLERERPALVSPRADVGTCGQLVETRKPLPQCSQVAVALERSWPSVWL